MNANTKRSALSALGTGMLGGLQWRLALLWIAVSLLPTLVVALPLWGVLDDMTGHSVHADAWVQRFDGLMFSDVVGGLVRDGAWTGFALLAGVAVALAVSPFLAGMAVASGRAGRSLAFGPLLQGGATEYGRMLRLFLLSLVPYALAAAAMAGLNSVGEAHGQEALLERQADAWAHGMLAAGLLVFAVAQAIVDTARAQFVADITLRSAFRAVGRALVLLVRRPVAMLLVYLLVTLVGLALVTLVAAWRGHVTATGTGAVTAFLIVQLGVAVVAWMRTSRLLALAALSPISAHRRRRTDFAPAL